MGQMSNGYVVWHPKSGKFINCRHERFKDKLTYKNIEKENLTESDDVLKGENDSDKQSDETVFMYERNLEKM